MKGSRSFGQKSDPDPILFNQKLLPSIIVIYGIATSFICAFKNERGEICSISFLRKLYRDRETAIKLNECNLILWLQDFQWFISLSGEL